MVFAFGGIVLDIDVKKTRALYERLAPVTAGCSCSGCRNYERAAADFPPEVRTFFSDLGIDPEKACEVISWFAEDGGRSMYYGGFYHLCGSIVSGEDCWTDSDNISIPNQAGYFTITNGYSVGFTSRISLPEEALTTPAVQMEIGFHGVPWKLPDENPY